MSVGTCSRIWECKSATVRWLFVCYLSHQDELWMKLGNITHRRKLITVWCVAAMDHTSVRMLSLVNTANIFLVSCLLNCVRLLLCCCMWGVWPLSCCVAKQLFVCSDCVIFTTILYLCICLWRFSTCWSPCGLCRAIIISGNLHCSLLCFLWHHVVQQLPLFQFAVSCTQYVQTVLVTVRFLLTLFEAHSGSVSFSSQTHVTSNKHIHCT